MENFSIKIDENVRLRLYKICRLCGDDSPNNTDILANSKNSTNVDPDFHKKIFDCIGIQVTKGDKMPQTACNVCREKINDFFDFREMCLATDVQTRRLLGLPETVVPKPDPALDAIEDDKTEVEKTIKKKNPVAIKALKAGKVLKSEKRSAIELRKGSLGARRSFPETRRSSLQENKKTALPDIKKAPPDIKKGPPETRRSQMEIKKGPPETRRSLLESKNKTTKPELRRISQDVKKQPVEMKKPIVEVKKTSADVKKPPSDVKKPLAEVKKTPLEVKKVVKPPVEVKKTPLEVKKVVKLEREKALLKLKKKVQISVHQMSNAELKKKFKDDPDRLARAKKRKASGDLLTEKPPNKRERLRDTIVRKFNNPEIALDTVATNVTCKICSKPFCNAGELHRHLDTDHLPRVVTFHCIRCNESLEKKQDIKDHNLWHKLSKTPYECGRCTKTITNLAVYTKHVQNCSGFIQDFEYKTKVCPICKEEFQTQNLYNWHKCIINQLKCEVCQQKFTKKGAMVKHVVRCSAIGLNTSLPVVDSAIEPDPEPETEPPPEMNDHFGDDDNDEDDAEMNLKPNLEIDIEVPREEPEPEPEEEEEEEEEEKEEKEATPFVVIPPPAASTEISRPNSNSSSSVAAANSIPSRAPSVHSYIADDDASNASNVQTGNVVMPMVCIKFENTLRNVVPAETNNQTTNNVAVRVKAEVVDSAYRGLYDNTTCQNIKVEKNTEENPRSGAATPVHSEPAASDDMDEPMDDLPDGGASSRSVTPPLSPVPETNPTPPLKPTLKLVIKKQHGTLNSSFVEGSDVPRDESEPHPKKKKKKKAKIFKIPKGLALRLRQEKIQSGNDEGNDEGDDASSGTNNENEEEEERPQDTLPVISNVCSKYTDGNPKEGAGHIPVADAVQVRIKQERLDNDDDAENRATEESASGSVTEEQEEEEVARNTLPVISKVFSKQSKANSRVKKPSNTTLDKTIPIKQERLDDEQQNSIGDNAAECNVVEIRIKRERVDNDDEVSNNSNISENAVAQIQIKQEREDVENASNSSEGEPIENDNNDSERNQLIREKSRGNVKMATRNSRLKQNDRRTENLVVGNVQVKQEKLLEADIESVSTETPAAESNEDQQEEVNPGLSKTRSLLSKPRRIEVNPANKKVLDTDVQIKQEKLDTATEVQRYTTDVTTQNAPESVDINLGKRPGRSLRNTKASNVPIRIKEERIDNDEVETETEEQDSNISDENSVVSALDKSSSQNKRTRNTSDSIDSSTKKRRGRSLRNKEVSDNVRVKEERIDSDEAEADIGEHDSNISDETSAARVLDKTISTEPESASSKNRASQVDKASEIRIKEENMESEDDEQNADDELEGNATASMPNTQKNSRSKSKPKNSSGKERDNVVVDGNVRVKQESVDAEEPETNLNTVIPIISQVFSQHIKSENDENTRQEKSAPNLTQENIKIKQEKEDNEICIIDSDDEDDEVVVAQRPNIPVISLLSPDRSDPDPKELICENVEAESSLPANVRVKQERMDTDECNAITDTDTENVVNVAASSSPLRKHVRRGNENEQDIENSLDKNDPKRHDSGDVGNAALNSVQKSRKIAQLLRKKIVKTVSAEKPPTLTSEVAEKSANKRLSEAINDVPIKEERLDADDDEPEVQLVQPLRKKIVKAVSTEKPPTLTSEVAEKSANKRVNKAINDVSIKEERLDEDDDEPEVELVDLTEIIEIPDESVPVIAQPQAKRQKVNNQNSTSAQIAHEDPGGQVRIKEELPESEENEQDIDANTIKRSTTVINPLAARLKRSSRKRKNINPLNPANLGLLQTRIKRERLDGGSEGSPVADRFERTSLENMDISSASDTTGEKEVNEINSESTCVRIKEEPVENTHSHGESELNVVNEIHSTTSSKEKADGKKNVPKATGTIVKNIAPAICKTVNARHDLAEKSVPSSEEPRPMLRIKSEFNTFNFNNEEDHRTPVDNESNAEDMVSENQGVTDGHVIKTEPLFDGPVKEELVDYEDDDDSEQPDYNADIKEEPLEFYATEEMQSLLPEGSNLVAKESIDNTLSKGSDVFVGATETNTVHDHNTEANVSEEASNERTSEPLTTEQLSTEEASSAIDTTQQVLVLSKAYADGIESHSGLSSVIVEQPTIVEENIMEDTSLSLEVSSEKTTDLDAENPVLERPSISDSAIAEQRPMDEETSTEDESLHLEVSSEQMASLSLEAAALEGKSLSDSVVDEQVPMDEEKSLNLEVSSGEKDENAEIQIESPSILSNPEGSQGFSGVLNAAEILTDSSNITSMNSQVSGSILPHGDEISDLIEKPIEIPVIACTPSSEMKDVCQVERMDIDHVQEDTCDKVLPSTHVVSYDCAIETKERELPPISTDLTAGVNEVTDIEVSAENISGEEEQFTQCIGSDVGSSPNHSASLEKVTQDEHESSLIEEKCLEMADGGKPMSVGTFLENSSSTEQEANEHNRESSISSIENVLPQNDVDQNVTIAPEQMATSEDLQAHALECQGGDINVQADATHPNQDAPNENNTTNIQADNLIEHTFTHEKENITNIEADNLIHEHVSNEENATNNVNSEHILTSGTENTPMDDHPIDGKIDVNEQIIFAEDANTEESDEKISDYDNATQESENLDECSEMEDSENIEDNPENDSDSNCNQKLKDLIKDNDNLLGFFEHELSRNNDSSSEERSNDQSTRDQGEDSSKESTENLKDDSKIQIDSGDSINSVSTVENQSNYSDNVHEEQCSKEEAIEVKNDKCETMDITTEGNISSEMDVSKDDVATDDCNVASTCISLSSGAESESKTIVAGSIDDPPMNQSVNPIPRTQMYTQPLQSAQNLNPPVNFSIDTLIGSAIGPSSSTHSIPIAPSITSLPKAIVSPTISPSISSYNAPPLSGLERVPTVPFISPLISSTAFNPSGNPVSSLHSIESPNNLSVIPPFVSSNINNPLPVSPATPSPFPNTTQRAFSSRLFNESPSHLNMLHINEIAENNNNANIERELQNDLESISSSSNMDFDETTANSISDVSETNVLTNASNIDNAAVDH